MNKLDLLEQVRKEIECKREGLNKLVINEMDKGKVLIFSMELDNLINGYYNLLEI